MEASLTRKQSAPTVEDMERVAAMTDPVLRNLRITQAYHELKLALADLFGTTNVSWCAYATWASKTAGRFIRREEVPATVRRYLAQLESPEETGPKVTVNIDKGFTINIGAPEPAAAQPPKSKIPVVRVEATESTFNIQINDAGVAHLFESILGPVTAKVADGNLLVFQELGPAYARMVTEFAAAKAFDQKFLDGFLAQFKPGPIDAGGQDYLIEAFHHYYLALFEADAKKKAEYLFYANALAGYHEQTRLQDAIAGSLNAPIAIPLMGLAHAASIADLPPEHHAKVRDFLENFLHPVASSLEKEWREFSTRWLMTLNLPEVALDLGLDVPVLSDGRMFPSGLELAEYPPLVALLGKLDRTANSLLGSAARDWSLLGDRMNYVVDFFRSRQQDASLYLAPFDNEQLESIRRGELPAGRL